MQLHDETRAALMRFEPFQQFLASLRDDREAYVHQMIYDATAPHLAPTRDLVRGIVQYIDIIESYFTPTGGKTPQETT